MKASSKEQFLYLQERALSHRWKALEFQHQLELDHGGTERSRVGKMNQGKLWRLRERERKSSEKLFKWLDMHSPRGWRRGVPANYVLALSYEDATTKGRLSKVPPPAYGSTPEGMERFSQPVRQSGSPHPHLDGTRQV